MFAGLLKSALNLINQSSLSCEAKKKQQLLSELFTRNTTKNSQTCTLVRSSWQLAPSCYNSNASYYVHGINKSTIVEITTILKYRPL